jgi:anti-sigma regulatory factor (Ser/Thr protein kinase)
MILELNATPQEVMRAVEALQTFAQSRGIPDNVAYGLALALEECGSNIVNHALRRDPTRKFQIAFQLAGDTFVIELRDNGPEFDPTAAPERALRAEDDDLPGGWGIPLVRRHTDAIQYRREFGENVLRLVKRLGAPV